MATGRIKLSLLHYLFTHIGVGARELVSKKISISKNLELQSLIISDLAQPPARRESLEGIVGLL